MSSIKILGAYGGRGIDRACSSLQVSKSVVVDAGDILNIIGEEARHINHIFLTHSHLDHIADIPFLIDAFFEKRTTPLNIYARKGTLDNLKKFIFNWEIWPDFCEIKLMGDETKDSIEFHQIELGQEVEVDGCILKAINTNHTPSSCGFVITKENKSWLFTADTYTCDEIWDEINKNKKISSLIIDVSFPSRFKKLAHDSKHLTPLLLKEELKKLKRDDVTIYASHLKPAYVDELKQELDEFGVLLNGGKILGNNEAIK